MPEKTRTTTTLAVILAVSAMPALAAESSNDQTVTVGPWTIATTYKGDSFENCTMSRSVDDLGVTFLRNNEGLLLSLNSDKWRLDVGKAYPVHLAVGSQDVEATALAASKSVTITLVDTDLNKRLRNANTLKVRGEGMTLSVPLDGSAAGLERLDECFEKNLRQSPESNPFVAPSKKP
ncbi:hypothetical protein AB4144_36750 [Rhizobiaceae sp. 2RAB30]